MNKKLKILLPILLFAGIATLFAYLIRINDIAILNPSGTIAEKQRNLLVFATLLGMIVVVPVFIMTATFAYRYREGNKKAAYRPDWDKNHWLEAVWWGIPIVIIIILSIVTWRTTHDLDPYKPLETDTPPVTIQVVALQWKWLFIYPDQNIATVNYIQVPEKTPINFEIAADAPMNSFWIPKLGGQVYAMNGMVTKLHLQADEIGEYDGVSSNISGEGFASMRFKVRATTRVEFDEWVASVKRGTATLDHEEYAKLAQPTSKHPVTTYSAADHDLYDTIVMKYMDHTMQPDGETDEHANHAGHEINSGHQH